MSNITGVNKATVLVDKSLGGANLVAAIIPEMIMHKDGKISIIEKESECKKYESEEHEIPHKQYYYQSPDLSHLPL